MELALVVMLLLTEYDEGGYCRIHSLEVQILLLLQHEHSTPIIRQSALGQILIVHEVELGQ